MSYEMQHFYREGVFVLTKTICRICRTHLFDCHHDHILLIRMASSSELRRYCPSLSRNRRILPASIL